MIVFEVMARITSQLAQFATARNSLAASFSKLIEQF
jgi:hypothetical protein